jgi:hypothetical protein
MTLHTEYAELDDLGRGRFRQSIALKPIAYRKDGSLRRIGNVLASTAAHEVGIDELCQVRIATRIAGKSPVLTFGHGKDRVAFSLAGANNVAGVVSDNRVYFANAWNNADLEYITGGHRLQESIFLRAGHPRSFGFILQEHTGFDPATLSFGSFRMLDPTLEKGDVSIPLKWIVSSRGGKYHLVVNLPGGDWQGWTLDPTLTLQPAAADGVDTLLNSTATTVTYNYGISPNGFIRIYTIPGSNVGLDLVQFDISSLPAGATLNSATLTETTVAVSDNTAVNIAVYRALTQWYEGAKNGAAPDPGTDGSTWNLRNANGAVAWAGGAGGGAGLDYAVAATATATVTVNLSESTWNVLADVSAWYAGTATNYGWWVRAVDGADKWKAFGFSDHATAAYRPKLVVDYTLPAAGLLLQLQSHGVWNGGTL